jgi:hypothetical protein
MRIALASFVLMASLVGSVTASCPLGDVNKDCQVDLQDLSLLAEQWLAPPDSSVDLNGDDSVNMVDLALLAESWHEAGIAIVINEVLASNATTTKDPQGQYDDWIELYNYGNTAVDVGGMYLSDNLEQPTMWQIPASNPAATTIPAGGYLLIWADNDTADAGLHANFQLGAGGDDIGLFAADGSTLIDSISFGEQRTDISFGRFPDAGSDLRLMAFASPGWQNIGGYEGFVDDPRFSHERGLYNEGFYLTISTQTDGAVIYYTTDGSEPYQTGGRFPTGKVYIGPVTVSRTTCLRAKAIKFGWQPSRTVTQTYIFLKDVIRQSPQGESPGSGWPTENINGQVLRYGMGAYIVNHPVWGPQLEKALTAIPTMSVVTDLNNLFDRTKGIYVNANQHGSAWERPISLELIYPPDPGGPGFPDLVKVPDGHGGLRWELPAEMQDGFQINAGLRIRGGYSRQDNNPKHAFRLFFRSEYGDGKLDYPLFGDEGVDSFDKVDLATAQNYSWSFEGSSANTMCRDIWARDSQGLMGQAYSKSRYYHLYINGQYWGIFLTQERPEAAFAASYFGGDREEWDCVKATGPNAGYTIEATDGNLDAWQRLWELGNMVSNSPDSYYRAQGLNPDGTRNPAYPVLLDVDNLIDYMMMVFYDGDRDAPISDFLGNRQTNNWYGIRNRSGQEGFRFFVHDAEHTLSRGLTNRTGPYQCGDQFRYSNPQWIHQELMAHPEYCMRFADRAHKYLFDNGLLTSGATIERFRARAQQIDMAIIAESARWGSASLTKDTWLSAINNEINNFFPSRAQVFLNQLKNTRLSNGALAPLYPSVTAPVFSQHGGLVPSGFALQMQAPAGTIYYTLDGSEPSRSQTAQQGTTLTLISENAAKRVLVPTAPIADNWKGGGAFDDSAWISGIGGVGFEASSGYEALINIDLREQMYNRNASCYIRTAFTFTSSQSQFNSVILRMRYDDAFVAYINGIEVARRNFTGEPSWDSRATASHSDSAAIVFEDIDISSHIGALRQGDNILAVHGMNSSASNPDFLISVELTASTGGSSGGGAPAAAKYAGPITLTRSTQVKARVLSGSTWSALNEAVFAVGAVAENLRITEIMYHPADTDDPNDPNEEFIELKNIGSETINLNLARFTNGVDFTFPSLELAAGKYVLVVRDQAAFYARYPDFSGVIAGQFSGSLANEGERIWLEDAIGQTILDFKYSDAWREITDGQGFSLTIVNPANPDANSWGEKDSWRASAFYGGSPGWDDTGIIPEPGSVVINEVLAHAHADASDWIELYNTTGEAINIGGWFLSDDGNDLTKYQIADGTVIAGNGYIVFYQDQHFGNPAAPGCHTPYALSENGDQVYLSSAQDGVLTGYQELEDFDASETGVSFGRYYKGSTDNYNFVAMSENTPGKPNSYPKVGPIVINEIMYNPGSGNQNEEYIELFNISSEPVDLYRYDKSEPWRFTDGIEFVFPSDPVVTIPAGGYLLVVKHLDAFAARYGVMPAAVVVLGPYDGQLQNGGEKLELSMPGDVDEFGTRYYIRIDRLNYSDGSHPEDCPGGVDLWPPEADGGGMSLSRRVSSVYGNDVANWKAASPSPGVANP